MLVSAQTPTRDIWHLFERGSRFPPLARRSTLGKLPADPHQIASASMKIVHCRGTATRTFHPACASAAFHSSIVRRP